MTKLVHRTNVACPSHEASTLASSRHRDCRWVALRSHARHRRLQPSPPVHTLACAHRTLQVPFAHDTDRAHSAKHTTAAGWDTPTRPAAYTTPPQADSLRSCTGARAGGCKMRLLSAPHDHSSGVVHKVTRLSSVSICAAREVFVEERALF